MTCPGAMGSIASIGGRWVMSAADNPGLVPISFFCGVGPAFPTRFLGAVPRPSLEFGHIHTGSTFPGPLLGCLPWDGAGTLSGAWLEGRRALPAKGKEP